MDSLVTSDPALNDEGTFTTKTIRRPTSSVWKLPSPSVARIELEIASAVYASQ